MKDPAVHQQAVELRQSGQSFAAIATTLGYQRAGEAQLAFLLGLRHLPTREQTVVRHDETGRLDRLETNLRARTDLSDIEQARRIKVLDQLRHSVMKNVHTLESSS